MGKKRKKTRNNGNHTASKNNISRNVKRGNQNIRPKKKGLYHINGESNSAFKIYCKACIIETECENIWKDVLKFVKHAKLIW